LVFDANSGVRITVFDVLISWVSTLEDKEDIEIHLVPYILIGTVDPELGEMVLEKLNRAISDVSAWVRKHASNFLRVLICRVKDDFGFITKVNVDSLFARVVQLVGPIGMREYMYDILQFALSNPVSDKVLSVIAQDNFWLDVLVADNEGGSTSQQIALVAKLYRLGGYTEATRRRILPWIKVVDATGGLHACLGEALKLSSEILDEN
jgi:hypothetical protein